jgi:bromodomain and PHD finger-containing protein 1
MGAHRKCYGILEIPEGDWICDACCRFTKEERQNIPCALCPVKGGVLKPTVHPNNMSYKNYIESSPETVWCHIFCALHVENVIFQDKATLSRIDLSKVDARRFSIKCQICETRNGAVLQCQHGRCHSAFHPECGKAYFTNTRDKTGYDEVSIYCSVHRPLKLRRMIESKEKKYVEEIYAFCKTFQHVLHKQFKQRNTVKRKRTPVQRHTPFSLEEKFKLIKKIDGYIKQTNDIHTGSFTISFKLSSGSLRSTLNLDRPKKYNIIHPDIIRQHKLTISGRNADECYEFYTKELMSLYRSTAEFLGEPTEYIQPTKVIKKKIDKYVRPAKKRGRHPKNPIPDTRLYKTQLKLDSFVQAPITELTDLTSQEVYCTCRRPFVEGLVRRPEWTDEEYEKRVWDNGLINCDKCEEWFHKGCVGIELNTDPGMWICEECKIGSLRCNSPEASL